MKEARQFQRHLQNVPVLESEFHGAVLALPRLPGIYCRVTAAGGSRRHPGSAGLSSAAAQAVGVGAASQGILVRFIYG